MHCCAWAGGGKLAQERCWARRMEQTTPENEDRGFPINVCASRIAIISSTMISPTVSLSSGVLEFLKLRNGRECGPGACGKTSEGHLGYLVRSSTVWGWGEGLARGGDYQRSCCDTPPPAICENLGGGGGGGLGVVVGGGRLGDVGGGFQPRGGGVPRWGGLRVTHYYHRHTSRRDVCLRVWGYGGMHAIIALSRHCRERKS